MNGTFALTQSIIVAMGIAAAPLATETPVERRGIAGSERQSITSNYYDYLGKALTTNVKLTLGASSVVVANGSIPYFDSLDRETTLREHAIGELRRWKSLSAGWDGENAQAPISASIQDAVRLLQLLKDGESVEPMLHPTGRAGLFWRGENLYADLEFLGGRIAYFVERDGNKHKGVVHFDAKELPAVLLAVLPS